MSKYQALTNFLNEIDQDEVTMTFESINDLIGGDLPESAFKHRPWWANRKDGLGSQNLAWQSVGWETRAVNMELDEVTFTKTRPKKSSQPIAHGRTGLLTIAQAKAGLAATFGVSEEAIEINIRG
ncbi:hypothetical protein GRI58_14985 [Porphyrobacter algicida]|uniref:DUF7662 domain-containing protein n=1 Tax=Qipengyuania algicida TaxID=1836209 RepID=A0A845AHJ8_9SPHN|nr:hypothetical protein [Qipengyuania algicida]MXP30112.1 hypothetical protein [Qipengyuania algicida]